MSQIDEDPLARLGECFVRMQIDKIVESEIRFHGERLKDFVYNPNEIDVFETNLMNMFKPLADTIIANSQHTKSLNQMALRQKAQALRDKYSNIFYKVPAIACMRFQEMLIINRQRYSKEFDKRQSSHQQFHDIENVINAVCHPDTIKSACLLYLEQIKNETAAK